MQYGEFDSFRQAELVSRTQHGDAVAFGRLYDDTFAQVYRYAMMLTRKREDAEDLTAETYERALRSIHRFKSGETPILAWLFSIARNVARERARRAGEETGVPFDELEAALGNGEQVDSQLICESLLQELTPAQREVVRLRLAGLKGREIAGVLGKAEGTVKALQFAAMNHLRNIVRL